MHATEHANVPAAPAMSRRASTTTLIALGLIVLVGVALRLWLISFTPLNASFSTADDGDYYQRAFRFAVTGQYIDDGWLIRPPLHVLFFAFWQRSAIAIGHPQIDVLLIQLAQTACAALTILLGFGVARRLFSSALAGLLFAAFLSFWFPFVEQPSVLFSELLYLMLFMLHFWLLLRFDHSGRWRDLALSGLALGAAALTRSPALYSLAFVALWLLVRLWQRLRQPRQSGDQIPTLIATIGQIWRPLLSSGVLVVACCLAIVLPWTIRNAIVYQRLIPVDTLGQINLWLDLDAVSKRNDHIAELRQMPQADRQAYALAKAKAILAEDPLRPFRPMWSTFVHIWKAQYVEDFFIKQGFFTRPLRETAALGLFGDLLWFVYTLGGLIWLMGPAREGMHSRLFILAWLGYSFLTVLVFHVEPRYLLPIWTFLALYGAGALAQLRHAPQAKPWRIAHYLLAAAISLAFVALVVSYRNYPEAIARGMARERAVVAGERAYQSNDYASAERWFREALSAQPDFVDAQIDLALALEAQGQHDAAKEAIKQGGSRRADLLGSVLTLRDGDSDSARSRLTRTEASAGEPIQAWALEWMRPPATAQLHLGDGRDIGYIAGFTQPEQAADTSFRWLTESGRVVLPLPAPLSASSTVVIRVAAGKPGTTPLSVRVGAGPAWQLPISDGSWRDYRLPIPPDLAGQTRLELSLSAPPFIPASGDPSSTDLRVLSVRISDVRVE